jgi:hypothetical protein
MSIHRVRQGVRTGKLVDTIHKIPRREPTERGHPYLINPPELVAWHNICKREPPLGIDFRGEGSPDGEEDCCHFHAGT